MLKKITFIIIILCFTIPIFALNISLSTEFKDFDIKASADISKFKTDVSLKFKIPQAKIEVMLNDKKMAPSDVYLTGKLSELSEKPVDKVVKQVKANKRRGWGVIAKSLGIKPGSREFHELKRTMRKMKNTKNDKRKGRGRGRGKGR